MYEELKFMSKMFPLFPITSFFSLPLVLNSWSKVQFWDKILQPGRCSNSSWTFCVRNSILTRSKRTQGLVFEIRIWASTLVVLLYFVSYLIYSPRFTPRLHFGPQPSVRVLYWPDSNALHAKMKMLFSLFSIMIYTYCEWLFSRMIYTYYELLFSRKIYAYYELNSRAASLYYVTQSSNLQRYVITNK